MSDFSTITAPATNTAPSGICVIRVSGDKTKEIIKNFFVSKTSPIDNPRSCVYGKFVKKEKENFDVIDTGILVFFNAPNSYTGEDVAEIHTHGNPLIVKEILNTLYSLGAEPAGPGEFTKRAFLNNKMDLSQAEAVNDIILANAKSALKISKENLEGKFSKAIQNLGEPLWNILSELEAHIDFPEEDITPSSLSKINEKLKETENKILSYIQTYDLGQSIKNGFRVLILGAPNSGKSSLLNKLLNRERAIVTDISGTTRDLLEESATLGDLQFIFCDSAGIRDTQDVVEKIGVELAKNKINWADLILLIACKDNEKESKEIYDYLKKENKDFWILQNKIDILDNDLSFGKDTRTLKISALKNIGILDLISELQKHVYSKNIENEDCVIVTNERHLLCLKNARKGLKEAQNAINTSLPLEIISSEIRLSLTSLEEIIGKTFTEDILGRIFSKFCIGK